MRNQRAREGLLIIDHRAGMGLGPAGATPLAHGTLFEAPTYTCSHCQRVVVINPGRTRSRGYCPKCDNRVCDTCELARAQSGGECLPFAKIIDEALERALKTEN